MSHLKIFGLIITLITGGLVFSRAWQLKEKKGFPKPFLTYVLAFNLLVLAYFFTQYLYTNVFIPGSDLSSHNKFFVYFRMFLFILSEFAVAYTAFRTAAFFKKEKPSKATTTGFFLVLAMFSGLYIKGISEFIAYRSSPFLFTLDSIWEGSLGLVVALFGLNLIRYSKVHLKGERASYTFGIYLVISWLGFSVSHVSYYLFNVAIGVWYDPIILLLINILSFIWIKYFFIETEEEQVEEGADSGEKLEEICRAYEISPREMDIVKCLVEGKSNNEIADQLFISFHTVKNHVYTILKKFDVKSRSQLTAKINEQINPERGTSRRDC